MASRAETAELVVESIPGAHLRRMFGEYALYLRGRVIGLICDDRLYLKNLPEAAAILAGAASGPPFPGAKPYLIADPWLDDPEVLAKAAQVLADLLPEPKPKRRRKAP